MDGVGNIDIKGAINFHMKHGRLATLTTVQPGGRFGAFQLKDSTEVTAFHERPKGDGAWVNGGFFVLEPEAIDCTEGYPAKAGSMGGATVGSGKLVDTLRDE
jgi:glucose-1-phosphate cytidylyltransferase